MAYFDLCDPGTELGGVLGWFWVSWGWCFLLVDFWVQYFFVWDFVVFADYGFWGYVLGLLSSGFG